MSKKKVYREVPFLSSEPEEQEAENTEPQETQTLNDSQSKQEQEGQTPTQEEKASAEPVKAVTSEKPKKQRKASEQKITEELPANVKDILSQLTDTQLKALYFSEDRERRTKRISVTMTPSLYDKIAAMATKKGDSVNNMINVILEEGVK